MAGEERVYEDELDGCGDATSARVQAPRGGAMNGNRRSADLMWRVAQEYRRRGGKVLEWPDWRRRGYRSDMTPEYLICHHPAAVRDNPQMHADGRSGLPGPIDNWDLFLDGTLCLIASGSANHAGVGIIPSSRAWGLEATGPVPMSPKPAWGKQAFPQYRWYVVFAASVRAVMGWGNDRIVAHKETARPLGRKVDPHFDMDEFRREVQAELTGKPDVKPPAPPPASEDAVLIYFNPSFGPGADSDARRNAVYVASSEKLRSRHVSSGAQMSHNKRLMDERGVKWADAGEVGTDWFDVYAPENGPYKGWPDPEPQADTTEPLPAV